MSGEFDPNARISQTPVGLELGSDIDPAREQLQSELIASLSGVTAPEAGAPTRSRLYSAFVESPFGKKVTATALTVGFGGAGVGTAVFAGAEQAAGDTGAVPAKITTVSIVSRGLSVNAEDVAQKKIVVGEDVNVKIDKKTIKNCVTTKPGQPWTNSVKLANGKEYKYTETVSATLCRDKYAKMGWIKVAGGKTGRNCHNDANPGVVPGAHKNVEVLNVKSLKTSFNLVAKVLLDKSVECPGVKGSGYVQGEVKQRFSFKDYLKLKGSAKAKVNFKLVDKASVKASLNLNCYSSETTSTTTTPETTTTNTTTTTTTTTPNNPPSGRGDIPHRYVNTVDKVCVDPSDPDGDAVTVSNFKFTNTSTGATVGNIVRGVYTLPNTDIQCVDWAAPDTAQSVTWTTEETDTHGAKGNTIDEFPVLANDTGTNQV